MKLNWCYVYAASLLEKIWTDEFTDNTNKGELELYSILGECDNAVYPLTYMLLSTASSITDHKRRDALVQFMQVVRGA